MQPQLHFSLSYIRIGISAYWSMPKWRWASKCNQGEQHRLFCLRWTCWFSCTFVTCTGGSPWPWCTGLLHILVWSCYFGALQKSPPVQSQYETVLSELEQLCCSNDRTEREESFCSFKTDEQQSQLASLGTSPLGWEGIFVLRVPGGKELWSWSFSIDKWFSHFTAISPIIIFIFCLGGLQLPCLFILLFAFRASLCLFSTISLFAFFFPQWFYM